MGLRGNSNVLGKYKTFSVPIQREVTKINKDGNQSVVPAFCEIKFIDSARFMVGSLSNLVDDLAEQIYKIKCKDCDCLFEYGSVKVNLIKYKSCYKGYSNKLDEKLKKQFKNTFKFSDNDISRFILLLRKGVYPHEYMDEWEKFNETTSPEKEEFYSNLTMEDNTDADDTHVRRSCKDIETKTWENIMICILRVIHYFWLMFSKTSEKMCLKTYELDPVKFLSVTGLAWQAAFKKTQVKLELLTNTNMLLMVEKGIRREICLTTHQYAKANNRYMKGYSKNKESSYLKYWGCK